MTTNQPDRIDRIEALLENFIAASASDRASSNERMTSLEQSMDRQNQASNERMTRLEQTMERQNQESNERMTRVEQVVEIDILLRLEGRRSMSISCFIERYLTQK